MHFCKLQEVMFLSSKYTIYASPGPTVSKPSRILYAASRNLNRLQTLPSAESTGCDRWQTIFAFAVACCLVLVIAGCGSGFHGPALGSLQITPGTVNFGAVAVGQVANNSITVVNESSTPVAISNLSFAGGTFSASGGDTLPISIPAGGSHLLQVQFKPTTAGAATGQLTVSSNSSTDNTAVVALSGMGMAPASPQLTVSAANLSFGSVALNSPTTQSVTLTSTGTAPVTVTSTSISGPGFTVARKQLSANVESKPGDDLAG